jgi:hypothetical protein
MGPDARRGVPSFADDHPAWPLSTGGATSLVPHYWNEESCGSWIDRTASALGADGALSDLIEDDPTLLEVLANLGDATDSQLKALDHYRASGQLSLHARASHPNRLYCPKCALNRFLEGRTFIREVIWELPWATSCVRDGTPLLEQPADPMGDVIRTQHHTNLDQAILDASERTALPWSISEYLDWSPLWRRLSSFEAKWYCGKALDDLRVISDIAAVLCADFYTVPEHSAIALLCSLPSVPYGYRLTEPTARSGMALRYLPDVHVRRTAMTVAYTLLEVAFMKSRLPRIFLQTETFTPPLVKIWSTIFSFAHPATWKWLLKTADGWPDRHAYAIGFVLKETYVEADVFWESFASNKLLARHMKRARNRRTIAWVLAPVRQAKPSASQSPSVLDDEPTEPDGTEQT